MACEWEDNVKYLVKHVENAEELSLLGFIKLVLVLIWTEWLFEICSLAFYGPH